MITKNKLAKFLQNSRLNLIVATVVASVVVLTGYASIQTLASGFFAAFEADQGTISGNAQVVSDATASGGKAVQFQAPVVTVPSPVPAPTPAPLPSPSPTPPPPPPSPPPSPGTQTLNCIPNPHLCGFPDATNTGVPAGTTFTTINGDYTITTAGSVVSGLHITGVLTIKADHVTVKNTWVECNNAGQGNCAALLGAYDTLQDSELGGGSDHNTFTNAGSNVYSGGTVNTNLLLRDNIHHSDDGLRLDGGTTVKDSYLHDWANGSDGGHSDGDQSCEGSDMSFVHNTIWGGNNDAIFLQGGGCGSGVNITNILVDHNLLIAFYEPGNQSGYGVAVARASGVVITNNQLSHTGWQVTAIGAPGPNDQITQYSGNIYDDDGSTVPTP